MKPAIFKYFKCKESLIKAATANAFDDIARVYGQVKNQFENDVEKIRADYPREGIAFFVM